MAKFVVFEKVSEAIYSRLDKVGEKQSVRVKVEGYGYYTGYHTFVLEKEDGFGLDGFSLKDLNLQ